MRASSGAAAPTGSEAYGTSTAAIEILLAAIRPEDPRYRALPLASTDMDAKLAFMVSGWGVLFPLERLQARQGARTARTSP